MIERARRMRACGLTFGQIAVYLNVTPGHAFQLFRKSERTTGKIRLLSPLERYLDEGPMHQFEVAHRVRYMLVAMAARLCETLRAL